MHWGWGITAQTTYGDGLAAYGLILWALCTHLNANGIILTWIKIVKPGELALSTTSEHFEKHIEIYHKCAKHLGLFGLQGIDSELFGFLLLLFNSRQPRHMKVHCCLWSVTFNNANITDEWDLITSESLERQVWQVWTDKLKAVNQGAWHFQLGTWPMFLHLSLTLPLSQIKLPLPPRTLSSSFSLSACLSISLYQQHVDTLQQSFPLSVTSVFRLLTCVTMTKQKCSFYPLPQMKV